MKNPEGIGELYKQAVSRGLVGPSDDDALFVFTCAAHAHRLATRNVCGMFATMILNREQMWLFTSIADQETGARWFREWREAGGGVP